MYSFCNSLLSKVKERSEEAAVGENKSQREGHQDPGVASTTDAQRPIPRVATPEPEG